MVEPAPTVCEAKVDGQWLGVNLAEAAGQFAAAEKRCSACHGRVAVTGSYTAVVKRSLAHRRRHTGCPLVPTLYCGTPSRHPEAVE